MKIFQQCHGDWLAFVTHLLANCWVLSWNRQCFRISLRDTLHAEYSYYRCILCYFLWTRITGKSIVSDRTQCQKYCFHWRKQSNRSRYPASHLKSTIDISSSWTTFDCQPFPYKFDLSYQEWSKLPYRGKKTGEKWLILDVND